MNELTSESDQFPGRDLFGWHRPPRRVFDLRSSVRKISVRVRNVLEFGTLSSEIQVISVKVHANSNPRVPTRETGRSHRRFPGAWTGSGRFRCQTPPNNRASALTDHDRKQIHLHGARHSRVWMTRG